MMKGKPGESRVCATTATALVKSGRPCCKRPKVTQSIAAMSAFASLTAARLASCEPVTITSAKNRRVLRERRDRRAKQVHAAVAVARVDRGARAGEIHEAAPRLALSRDNEAAMRSAIATVESIDRRRDQRRLRAQGA